MKRVDTREIRPAIGGGFVIQTDDLQQYVTGRPSEWNGRSWMGYPCDQNDRIILHLSAVELFAVYSAGKVVEYSFYDPGEEWEHDEEYLVTSWSIWIKSRLKIR